MSVRGLVPIFAAASIAIVPTLPAQTVSAGRPTILPDSAGTPLKLCSSPGLFVNVKVDSTATGARRFAMGTATVAAGAMNAGTHRDVDEAVYFLSGGGRAFVATDTVDVTPGLMLYVPQGVRHGFISTGTTPVHFVWVISPQQLAERFRESGVSHATPCADEVTSPAMKGSLDVHAQADAWLKLVDAELGEESWRAAASDFRSAVSASEWAKQLAQARGPLGPVSSRVLAVEEKLSDIPGAPAGDYVVRQYHSVYGGNHAVTETLTLVREPDGEWRVVGYFIR